MRTSGLPPVPGTGAGLVFQQPQLFPWKTVAGNVELALRYAGRPCDQRRVDELAADSAQSGRTCVFVTHSVDEAVFLGSRVVVLSARPWRVVLDLEIGHAVRAAASIPEGANHFSGLPR